jgi:hypothetical protein
MVLSRIRKQARFVVLPPSSSTLDIPSVFRNVQADGDRYDELFAAMQRFRGNIYRADGAIPASALTSDGRHKVPIDEESWHVLSIDGQGQIVACLRYLDESHADSFHHLWVKHAAISRCPAMGWKFRSEVENRLRRTRHEGIGFGEVGGWAVAEGHRGTVEPLRIILATYGLLELLGGCSGLATATFRHSSATILQRIGLTSILAGGEEMAPYYDPSYQCQMQVLQFDSRNPAEKYRPMVRELAGMLTMAPVVRRESFVSSLKGVFRGFDVAPDPCVSLPA